MLIFDKILIEIDHAVNTLLIKQQADRKSPDQDLIENNLSSQERKRVIGLLRVNHCGEICAQALYYSQALITDNPADKRQLVEAGAEEKDHLVWLNNRLLTLNAKPSKLDPLFYAYSFVIGLLVGSFGRKWNFAFIYETEQQVVAHLRKHIILLPKQDLKSLVILQQMIVDEEKHSIMALKLGNHTIPPFYAKLMQTVAKFMTKTTYYL